MKKIYLFFVSLIVINCAIAQQCESFSEKKFRGVVKSMKKYKTDKGRLIGSERYLLGTCFSSAQMYEMALTFDEDQLRGEFLKKYAYSITDYAQIAVVFESFEKMHHALNIYEELRPQILEKRFSGIASHAEAMEETEFSNRLELVKFENYSRDKKDRIRVLFGSSFLNLKQIETLMNEFDYTRDKIWTVKLLYPRSTEKDQFYQLAKSFEYRRDRDEVLALMD
ncbi:DUF4476 domain-containing protein [Ekhidna sp.]|uniref:DUF4476 domain-containing protein n=1 Tax=Ekhidna sp. TaxID=2608089 RepID=UPI0032981D86